MQQALSLGIQIPSYRRAVQAFEELTKVPMSASSLQQLVVECGQGVAEIQAAEAVAMAKVSIREEEVVQRHIPEPDSEVMAVSMDGVMVNVREEGWKEVKVAAISAVESEVVGQEGKDPEVHLNQHSYRAGLWEAATFANQQWAEACRRGLEKAQQVVSINDGAAWIWGIILMCYVPCIEIIDWWHAVQKLWDAAHILLGTEKEQCQLWVKDQKSLLWDGNLRQIFHEIRLLWPRGQTWPEGLGQVVGYLFRNRRRMRYPAFRQAGYPIGSGSVESACKVVVQERMKQAGMRWSRTGAQAMLALRSLLLSERWNELGTFLTPDPKPT